MLIAPTSKTQDRKDHQLSWHSIDHRTYANLFHMHILLTCKVLLWV